MDQYKIPIQESSHSLEYTEKLFLFSKLIQFNSNNFSFANVPTPPSAGVLAFSQIFFKGLVTQFTMPLNPSNITKLDCSSGTR
jgi:hypothetical protein